MDRPTSVNVAALQHQIREYVALLSLTKKKREELKTMSTTLKGLGDDILGDMQEQNIPSCASMGYTFTVKDKTKMKSATAKSFLGQVKEYFNITDDAMESFMHKVDTKRKAEAEIIPTLECKPVKAAAAAATSADDAVSEVSEETAPTLSGTIDEMYS